jgi:hypothetical protein
MENKNENEDLLNYSNKKNATSFEIAFSILYKRSLFNFFIFSVNNERCCNV